MSYESSLKYYRDIKNVVDTSFEEGKIDEKLTVGRLMKQNGEPIDKIVAYTGLSPAEIAKL